VKSPNVDGAMVLEFPFAHIFERSSENLRKISYLRKILEKKTNSENNVQKIIGKYLGNTKLDLGNNVLLTRLQFNSNAM